MDFIIWCLLFPLVIVYAIDLHYRGFARKILTGFGKVVGIGFLLLIVRFIVVKIGWGGLALCVIFLPAVFIAGLFIFEFIRSKSRQKFW